MLLVNDTEFRDTVDQLTNPLPPRERLAGNTCESIVVGVTELNLGTGVAPTHSVLPPHETSSSPNAMPQRPTVK
jgi:hypothetical protein